MFKTPDKHSLPHRSLPFQYQTGSEQYASTESRHNYTSIHKLLCMKKSGNNNLT